MTNRDITKFLVNTISPLALIVLCPPIVMFFWYTNTQLGGSLTRLWELIVSQGVFQTIWQIWSPLFWGSAIAWKILGIFAVIQLSFMRWLPGKTVSGPITPTGHIPKYKANGLPAFFLTMLFFYLASYQFQWFSPTIVYDHFGEILGALNIFCLAFCVFLLWKGHFAPSTKDSGGTGNIIFDYCWGSELYPRIFGWDVKQFTNCRFGMMSWGVIIWSFAAKQQELYGLSDSMMVAVALQLIYITKFFIWETGYLRSLDIMHDYAGFSICWGCLVWVPGIYTSPTLYLVNHPNNLGIPLSILIFTLGTASILINFWADRQRQKVRETNGLCRIWGAPPVTLRASYTTTQGERKESVLLCSGWWGLARHFHYVPEILGALLWSIPAGFQNFVPYFYVVFLTILLVHRAFRDDERCARKYGEAWLQYQEVVPYKIIPRLF